MSLRCLLFGHTAERDYIHLDNPPLSGLGWRCSRCEKPLPRLGITADYANDEWKDRATGHEDHERQEGGEQ